MSFFFSESEVGPITKGNRKMLTVETLHRLECQACPLDKVFAKHPKMKPTGSDHPVIYMIGEAPGSTEDQVGKQFVGESGQLLRVLIPPKWRKKLRWNNCARTRPPKNATPSTTILECCRPSVVRDIEATKPKAIFGFGGVPLHWAVPSDEGIYKWRGRYLPIKVGNHICWFFPMLHPSGLLRKQRRNRRGKIIKSEDEHTFGRDLKRAFQLVPQLPKARIDSPYAPAGKPSPLGEGGIQHSARLAGVSYVTGAGGWKDVEIVRQHLEKMLQQPSTAIDIETTSKDRHRERRLRPYSEGASILSFAVGTKDSALAVPLEHREARWSLAQKKAITDALKQYLLRARGPKVAHNLIFELEWLGYFLGIDVVCGSPWADTMAQAYVLDERKGMLNLDVLIQLHFGFPLKKVSKVNRGNLSHEPLESVLEYNALDSLWTHRLYLRQKRLLQEQELWDVYEKLHVPRISTMALKQIIGVDVDFDKILAFKREYERELRKTQGWIAESKTAARFRKFTGHKFNPNSAPDVIELYRDVLKHPACRIEVEPGQFKYSADDEVLEVIGTPFARKLQRFRAYTKNYSTYVVPLLPPSTAHTSPKVGECIFPDGKPHTNIHTLRTDTGRTSASFPNEQNWPKRDEAFKNLRSMFVAQGIKVLEGKVLPDPEECYTCAIDQGQIEARVIEMAAKDKRYGKYLWDRHDIHMEWTERLARAYPARIGGKKFIKDKDVMKQFRTDIKNQWTFPLFFGANPWSVSSYLHIPIEVVDPEVDQFWQDYSGVKDWQDEVTTFYRKHGYVECLTGRRRREPITHNELINSPIQGTASDITVDAMTRLSEAAQELDKWQFQARMEIHDELVFAIPKKTFDRDIEFIVDYLLECKHMPFINVPLSIEIGRGPNWFEQEHVATLFSDDFGKIDRKESGF